MVLAMSHGEAARPREQHDHVTASDLSERQGARRGSRAGTWDPHPALSTESSMGIGRKGREDWLRAALGYWSLAGPVQKEKTSLLMNKSCYDSPGGFYEPCND